MEQACLTFLLILFTAICSAQKLSDKFEYKVTYKLTYKIDSTKLDESKSEYMILFAGDDALQNQYAYLPINPARYAHVNHNGALVLEDWLVSERGQSLIADHSIDGEMLFTPNAKDR